MEKVKKPFYKKTWFIIVAIIVLIGIFSSLKNQVKNIMDHQSKYTWSDNALTKMIPQPDSKYGKMGMENEEYFSIDIYKTSKDAYDKYVEACKEAGFTVDYSRNDDFYSAENSDGYSLMLNYAEKEKTLSISLRVPKEDADIPETLETTMENDIQPDEIDKTSDTVESIEADTVDGSTDSDDKTADGIRPELKEFLDSYEACIDEYCNFMKNYDASNVTMLAEYMSLLKKYTDFAAKAEKLDQTDMNSAELKYYTDVMFRVSQKMLDIPN